MVYAVRTDSPRALPRTQLVEVHEHLWFVKSLFHLGEGEREGLRYSGLRERLLSCLGGSPLDHAVLQAGDAQESTEEELAEERLAVEELLADKVYVPFVLDTTMTVVRRVEAGRNLLTLISPVECGAATVKRLAALGEVADIVVPSLQHWVFTSTLAERYPDAKIYWAPAACGEDMAEKLPDLLPRATVLENGVAQFGADLEARLLEGAPLNMNEFLFHHKPSNTLIASDAFYGGHIEATTWFMRLWFKLTKKSFRSARLPVYRTVRVHTDGSVDALLACVAGMVRDWGIDKILFAHGTNPYTEDAAAAFEKAWGVLRDEATARSQTDHSIKPAAASRPEEVPVCCE